MAATTTSAFYTHARGPHVAQLPCRAPQGLEDCDGACRNFDTSMATRRGMDSPAEGGRSKKGSARQQPPVVANAAEGAGSSR